MTTLCVKVFPGALPKEQKIGCWRAALEKEIYIKQSEGHHRSAGSKYMVGFSW